MIVGGDVVARESGLRFAQQLLSNTSLSKVMPATAVNTVTTSADVPSPIMSFTVGTMLDVVVKQLSERNVLSAPVFDSNNTFVGFVDWIDVASHVVNVTPSLGELKPFEQLSVDMLERISRAIALVPVERVINKSSADLPLIMATNAPTSELATMMANGVHRVAVVEPHNNVVRAIVSQSDVIQFLFSHMHENDFKYVSESPIKELGLVSNSVVTVKDSTAVSDVIALLVSKKLSGVALVDDVSGRITGNFSVKDLRNLFEKRLPAVYTSVRSFLEEFSPASLVPAVVQPTLSFEKMLTFMNESRVHRVFVVDDNMVPIGVITQTDIIRLIVAPTTA